MVRPPVALLTALYAAQGLPYGFFSLALPVLLREAGWSLTTLSLLQFLALPWALKFLWAPYLDHHGSRRGWLLGLQGSACLVALFMATQPITTGSVTLLVAVFLFNLLASTQDVVTDGLAVRTLTGRLRGWANGIQVGAYRLGMIIGGGALLWVYARSDWQVLFLCLGLLLALPLIPVLSMTEPARPRLPHQPGGWRLAVGWWHRAKAPGMLEMAALVCCYRLGDAMVSSLVMPFMHDQGVDKETLALMKGTVGSVTSLAGAALGGWFTARLPRRQAVMICGLAQAAGFLLYIAAAQQLGGHELLWAVTLIEGIVGSMATVALLSLMMDAADPHHAGADFTLLASVLVITTGVGGLLGGGMGDLLGYTTAFATGTVLAALGCLILVWWLDKHPTHARVAQAWRVAPHGAATNA